MTGPAEAESVDFPYVVNGRRIRMGIHARGDAVSNTLRRHRIWQRPLTAFFQAVVRPGMVVADVGAHIGWFSVLCGALAAPGGRVHAFEPDPRNRALLARNVARNRVPVTVHGCAVGGCDGVVWLGALPANPAMTSLADPAMTSLADPACADATGAHRVELRRLSTELAGERRLDVVKIDVQGLEDEVMDDLRLLLAARGWRPLVVVEVAPASALARDPALSWLAEVLDTLDMKAHLFVETGMRVVPPALRFSTLLELMEQTAAWDPKIDVDLLLSPTGWAGV